MQSTPSRTRHSRSIWAPLIRAVAGCVAVSLIKDRLDPCGGPEGTPRKIKRPSEGFGSPRRWPWELLVPCGLRGAGYDNQNNTGRNRKDPVGDANCDGGQHGLQSQE